MRKPKRRNSSINSRRLRDWTNEYAGYRHAISEDRIRDWIQQFNSDHQDVAARVLDSIDFVTHDQIAAAFKAVLGSLDGWHREKSKRRGKWRFVAYSASAGESGDSMLHKFRHANNLAGRPYDDLFIHRSDLLRQGLGVDDSVVFIDDFVGTGNQACDSWNNQFGELVAEVGRVYLVVVAARQQAVERVRDETELEIVPHTHLLDKENLFDPACTYFNTEEKDAILDYCKRIDRTNPKGHGDCGLLLVFAHGCPNNTIPVIHKTRAKWEPLFRRYD